MRTAHSLFRFAFHPRSEVRSITQMSWASAFVTFFVVTSALFIIGDIRTWLLGDDSTLSDIVVEFWFALSFAFSITVLGAAVMKALLRKMYQADVSLKENVIISVWSGVASGVVLEVFLSTWSVLGVVILPLRSLDSLAEGVAIIACAIYGIAIGAAAYQVRTALSLRSIWNTFILCMILTLFLSVIVLIFLGTLFPAINTYLEIAPANA